MHEVFHIIFDWEEISLKTYHLSDEEDDVNVVRQKENEADEFARDYMFPKNKMAVVIDRIDDRLFIREFAMDNHVHPSVVYGNYAYYNSTKENNLWKKI